jgi:hypothetical protein
MKEKSFSKLAGETSWRQTTSASDGEERRDDKDVRCQIYMIDTY